MGFSMSPKIGGWYAGQKVQKKHRVSVLRALRTLVRREGLELWFIILRHEKADAEWFGRGCPLRPRAAERLRV